MQYFRSFNKINSPFIVSGWIIQGKGFFQRKQAGFLLTIDCLISKTIRENSPHPMIKKNAREEILSIPP